MTIKSNGGIFSRNPTFNNVTVGGTLTVNGEPISNFGTMAQQDANSVAITGGTASLTNTTAGAFSVNQTGATNTHAVVVEFSGGNIGSPGPEASILKLKTSSNLRPVMSVQNRDSNYVMWITPYGNINFASGAGIDFSDTPGTGTSELFDDYEEGTWSPIVYFGAANVGMSVVTSGHYTLVGRLVVVRCSLTFSAKGSSTGSFQIGGLPFVGSINGAGAMGFNYGWATMPTGGVSFIQSSGSIYAIAANFGAYMDDTYFNDATAIGDITISYMI